MLNAIITTLGGFTKDEHHRLAQTLQETRDALQDESIANQPLRDEIAKLKLEIEQLGNINEGALRTACENLNHVREERDELSGEISTLEGTIANMQKDAIRTRDKHEAAVRDLNQLLAKMHDDHKAELDKANSAGAKEPARVTTSQTPKGRWRAKVFDASGKTLLLETPLKGHDTEKKCLAAVDQCVNRAKSK